MGKALVVCIDGTWNYPDQLHEDPGTDKEYKGNTNVVITWEALTRCGLNAASTHGSIHKLANQDGEALYLEGIGSHDPGLAHYFIGGTGSGTSERIVDAYRFLAERWQPGDDIYGFGFSRGAFAVRSLAGLIKRVGLPKSNRHLTTERLRTIYRQYEGISPGKTYPASDYYKKVKFKFLGLWDTVGSLLFQDMLFDYHKVSPPNVGHICHALALDEQRGPWAHVPWQREGSPQRLNEVWFAGTHANIGGGFSDPHLSNIALFWILHRSGLPLDLKAITGWDRERVDATKKSTYPDDWAKAFSFKAFAQVMLMGVQRRKASLGQRVHESVLDAMEKMQSRGESYQPKSLWHDGTDITPGIVSDNMEPWGL